MKSASFLLALTVIILSSCSTAYKTGQTPDDVYFSPATPKDEYVRTEKTQERNSRNDDYYDDRYLRMKVRNRYRWNDFNDWYGYERYGFGYNYLYGSYNNPYNSWNYWQNPYCAAPIFVNPKSTVVSRPRTFNLASYNTGTQARMKNTSFRYTNSNTRYNSTYSAPRNSTRNNNDQGNTLRDIFRGSNSSNNNNSSGTKPSSTSPSSSGSPSKSSGSSAPVRRF